MKKQYKSMIMTKVNFNSNEQITAACDFVVANGHYFQEKKGFVYCTLTAQGYYGTSDGLYTVPANLEAFIQYI